MHNTTVFILHKTNHSILGLGQPLSMQSYPLLSSNSSRQCYFWGLSCSEMAEGCQSTYVKSYVWCWQPPLLHWWTCLPRKWQFYYSSVMARGHWQEHLADAYAVAFNDQVQAFHLWLDLTHSIDVHCSLLPVLLMTMWFWWSHRICGTICWTW